MGLTDIFGKVANRTGQFIKETSTQMGHQTRLKEYKRQILNQLSTDELKHLCNHFAKEPKPPMDINDMNMTMLSDTPRKKSKFIPVRDDYIRALMNELNTSDIIDWCRSQRNRRVEPIIVGRTAYMKQHNIDEKGTRRTDDAIREQQNQDQPVTSHVDTQSQPIRNETISELIEKLEALPRTYNFANEERAHYWLLSKLEEWFPNRVLDEPNRKEVDISIDGKIAIEIKNFIEANPQQEINRLRGQITGFAHKYDAYIIVIFGGAENHRHEIMDMVSRYGIKNVEVVLV